MRKKRVEDLCKMVAALFTAITLSMVQLACFSLLQWWLLFADEDVGVLRLLQLLPLLLFCSALLRCLFRQSNPILFTKGHQWNEPKSQQRKPIKWNSLFHNKSVSISVFNLFEICLALVRSRACAKKFFVLLRISHRGSWEFPGFIYLIVNAPISLLLRFLPTFHFHALCIHHQRCLFENSDSINFNTLIVHC